MQLRTLAATTLVALVTLSGCSDKPTARQADDKSDAAVVGDTQSTEAPTGDSAESIDPDLPSNDELEEFFGYLGGSGNAELNDALAMTEPGSVAAAYVGYLVASTDASIDAGRGGRSTEYEIDEIDNGYRTCDEFTEAECIDWTDVQASGGKIVDFLINGAEIGPNLTVGDGTITPAGDASVEFLYAYQSLISDYLFVVARARAGDSPVQVMPYSATYADPSGRQLTAEEATAPGDLGAGLSATFVIAFPPPATLGGTTSFDLYGENYDSIPVQLATR